MVTESQPGKKVQSVVYSYLNNYMIYVMLKVK